MAGEANPDAISVRIEHRAMTRAKTQRDHDLRRGPQPGYVDLSLTEHNDVLVEPMTPAALRRVCEERRAQRPTRRAMRSDAAVATCGIITFGTRAGQLVGGHDRHAQAHAFRAVAEAVAARLDTTLTGLVVHRDETAIHAHFQLPAYDRRGVPLSKATRPAILSELQDVAAEAVQRHFPEVERGTRYGERIAAGASYADTVHRSVAELHRDLPRDLEAARAKLEKNERLALKAQAKAQTAETRAEKAEKAARNAETYLRRAETAREEVARLEARLDELRAREEAAATKEADLARREKELAREAEWTARAMGNLRVAVDHAMSGRHLEEITAEDMADRPEQFATLRKAAPEGRPTWGFRAEFWALCFSDSGDPAPLPKAVREAGQRAFAKVAAFARERLGLFEATKDQALRAAESAAERRLITARGEQAAAEEAASAARSEAARVRREAEDRAADVARREQRLDQRAGRELPDRERFFEDGFARLTTALRKVLAPDDLARTKRAYADELRKREERHRREQRPPRPEPPTSSYSP